jgi:hypothetical protein
VDGNMHETPQNWTNRHKADARSATHNPLVVGSIPTWPTHKYKGVLGFEGRRGAPEKLKSNIRPKFVQHLW